MTRVLVVAPRLGPDDGTSRVLADVAELLAEEGCAVDVACPACDRALPAGVMRRAPDGRYDVVCGSDPGMLLAHAARAGRVVYAPLDLLAADGAAEREALARCDALWRFTPGAVRVLEDEYGLALADKGVVAPYVTRAFEDAEPPASRPAPPRLLWVGRLIETKDVAFLLRAVARLRTAAWRFDVCGDGPERPALEETARALDIADRVVFRGFVRDLRPSYEAASLFLTASRLEHFSLTLVEAYAFGVPCLGRRPDGARVRNACAEQILDGETGYLFTTEHELAARVDELLTDEPKRAVFGRAGRARKDRDFSFSVFRRALRELFQLDK